MQIMPGHGIVARGGLQKEKFASEPRLPDIASDRLKIVELSSGRLSVISGKVFSGLFWWS